MLPTIRIASRFRGPPASGNGGYVAGRLAESLGGSDCEVTLRRPPPLDRDLELKSEGAERSLWDGNELIASAEPAAIERQVPAPIELAAAEAASVHFSGFTSHIFPNCFVCGPQRRERDGLRIFPGPTDRNMVAAPWQPTPELCDEQGKLRPRYLWAALDCPGFFAVEERSGPAVLGRFAVHVERYPSCDRPLIVVGWHLGSDGRKHQAGTALYLDEELLAFARATWISIERG